MFRYATTATRTLTRQAQPIAARAFSTSLRAALPTQGGVAPTTSSSSTGTDRGASQVADAQEGKTSPSLNRADQTTNTSASADVNSQPDPNHPQNPAHTAGEDGQGHIPSHTRGAVGANKDGIAGGGNPLKPGAAGRGFHTSARVGASSKPVEEQSAQHPGKSDIDHLENPSLSEEVVDSSYRVKLIDFGSAVIYDPRQPAPFYTRFHGTTSFASSEILRGEAYQAPSSEVWSLGVLLSILVTGECPFADAEAAKAGRITRSKVRLQPEVEHLMRSCLEVDVSRRITISQVRRHPWLNDVWARKA